MNCHEFREKIRDLLLLKRGDARCSEALGHASQCESCGPVLETECRLNEELKALAASHADESAPAAVEQKLLAAFRASERHVTQPAFEFKWRLWAPVAAGVVLFLVGGYVLLRRAYPPEQTVKVQPAPPSVAISEAPAAPKAVADQGKPRQARTAARARPAVRQPARQPVPTELVTAFFALPYPEPLRPDEMQRIVRVRMPRAALVRFGLPINEDVAQEPVDADVLVGEDNVARAVRLVGTWTPSPPSSPAPDR